MPTINGIKLKNKPLSKAESLYVPNSVVLGKYNQYTVEAVQSHELVFCDGYNTSLAYFRYNENTQKYYLSYHDTLVYTEGLMWFGLMLAHRYLYNMDFEIQDTLNALDNKQS